MSTETSTSSFFGESLSPAESAYFSSKGADTSALASEAPESAPEPAPVSDMQPSPQQKQPQDATSEGDDEGIYIDEHGKARSVLTGKFVPHGAFHKERERRKSAETELLTVREKMARADERLAVLNEIIAAGESPQQSQVRQQQEAPPPDPETDIFGYVKWQAEKINALENQTRQQFQQQEQYRVAQEVQQFYKNDAMSFMKQQADFPDAYQYVAQSFTNELRAKGFNDQQIQQQLLAEEAQIAWQCKQEGRSPSQVIYAMAKARGYGANGSAQPAPSQDAQRKIENIAKAQKATPSLSGAGGSSSEGLTLETLASMSDEEFAAARAKLGKSQWRKLLGG